MTDDTVSCDVAIRGAGPVGLALACLLVRRGVAADRIVLLDARPPEKARADPRSLALSHGSRQILDDIGVWPIAASSIQEIHVSRRGHFGRTLIAAGDYRLPALGHVTRYGVLVDALSKAATAAGVKILRPATVAAVTEHDSHARLLLAAGQSLDARIVVHAEGGLFGDQPARPRTRDYQQTAIVAEVTVSAPLPRRAFERFTEEGPLALLPLPASAASTGSTAGAASTAFGSAAPIGKPSGPRPDTANGHDYALVWCMRPATAQHIMTLSDADFLAALEQAFGQRVGRFRQITPRASFVLGLNADPAVTSRSVAIGNAAQTLHPVAGQGFNLGLRDAAVLARLLAREPSPAMLQRFIVERQADRDTTIRVTDLMARLFASAPDGTLSQALLGLSLGVVDAIAPAKRLLAEQMMYGQR